MSFKYIACFCSLVLVLHLKEISGLPTSWYDHLPVHAKTYVRHVHDRTRRSPFQRNEKTFPSGDGLPVGLPLTPKQTVKDTEGTIWIYNDVPEQFQFPERMRFAFNVDRKRIRLNLHLNTAQTKHTPVELMKNGEFILYNETEARDFAFYQVMDEDVTAAVMVRCENYQFPCYLVGSFIYKGQEYFVEPETHIPRKYSNIHVLHNVYKAPDPEILDYGFDTVNITIDDDPVPSGEGGGRVKRDTSQMNYKVGLQVVVDHSVFTYWRTKLGSDDLAVNEIQRYYEAVVNSIDTMYETATTASMKVDIVLLEIDIIMTSSDQPWIEENKFKYDNQTMVDFGKALGSFSWWLKGKTFKYNFDAIMSFSREELVSGEWDGRKTRWSKSTLGLAYLNTLCQGRLANSIVKQRNDCSVSRVAGHELGHTIGVDHDTERSDYYLMASSTMTTLPVEKASNAWTFSSRSIKAMETKLLSKDQNEALPRCFSHGKNESQQDVTPLRLGEIYSLNQQCNMAKGKDSRACDMSKYYSISKMCYRGLTCSYGGSDCSKSSLISVFSGSPCGTRKWCDKGLCVNKPPETMAPGGCAPRSMLEAIRQLNEATYQAMDPCWDDYTCTTSCSGSAGILTKCITKHIPGC